MVQRSVFVLVAMAFALVAAPGSAMAEPVSLCNVAIPASDGATLRANVFLPDSGGTRYPTALTVTGYNKDVLNPTGTNCSQQAALAATNPKLLATGYAVMVLDDRGTGASDGRWDSWGERTQADYPEVLDWIQAQPWSNGDVGTTGGSYMGITSLLVAEADAERVKSGKRRAVKAVWADVPMADAYRDVTFHGGAIDSGFIPLWLGLTSTLSNVPPSTLVSDPASALDNYAGHLANTWNFAGQQMLNSTLAGDGAYDGSFYRLRSPVERIESLTIPVAWTGGWWDIFQRGEPLLYEAMKNSRERKFWMTASYHTGGGEEAWQQQGIGGPNDLVVKWFDRWIKGQDNGIDRLAPVNLWTMGAERWQHVADWPVPGTKYTPFYLDGERSRSANSVNDGTLKPDAAAQAGGDDAPLLPASSPCSRLTTQWFAGTLAGPCETDNRSYEASSFTYTTPPLERDTEVTGPIVADLWAQLTSKDATLVSVLSDVDPSGKSTQLTAGFLLASQRAVDDERSTKAAGGEIVRPWHPFTKESQQPVPPNEPQRYQVEVYPTSAVFKKGHRIRLTVGTANTPATSPPVPALADQAGGEIRLLRGGRYQSRVLLPLVSGEGLTAANPVGLPARQSCVDRRRFAFRIHQNRKRIVRVRVYVGRKLVKDKRGRRVTRVAIARLPIGRFRLKVVATASNGQKVTSVRTYRGCRKGKPRTSIDR